MDIDNWFDSSWLKHVLFALIVVVLAIVLAKILRMIVHRYFEIASTKMNVDPTRYRFFRHLTDALVSLVAIIVIFYSIPQLRTLSVTLFAGAGIFAAILGFASQAAFANIINGAFLVISKPFRVGDMVKIAGNDMGVVEDITLRHTVIRSFENRRIIIPNASVGSSTILNSSIVEERTCVFVEMGISYDSDINLAMKLIQEEAMSHPSCIDGRNAEEMEQGLPQVIVRVIGMGDSSVNLRAYVWAKDPLVAFAMKCDLLKSIKERFDKEGVEIPFPYRTLVFKKDIDAAEKLTGNAEKKPS